MKAILCTSLGLPDTLQYTEVPDPVPGAKEVLVRIKACGVNFPDTLIIQGKYQFKPPLPFSPGSDIAGIVESVGENVKAFKPGDAVFGIVPWGGFAEKVVAAQQMLFPLLPGMDFPMAASFMMAYGTSYHALKDRAQLQPGETLLVLGAAGGVGLTAVELGKQMGARVIAAASSAEKLALCAEYGADAGINYSAEDLRERIKELTDGQGVDVVYDPVGGDLAEAALRSMAWKGRYLVVGFASGAIPQLPFNLPLLKGCSVMGVFWGAFATREMGANLANIQELLEWYLGGRLKPFIQRQYPLSEAPQALQDMMDRRVMGKVVITMDH
ncbi:MAG: NADPH:quinone oxidoreductase family protein [Lewinellaceae bacterium]|nr:NADPH:quinone oxidoreductase family protein [Lewinellaceae bacterium]